MKMAETARTWNYCAVRHTEGEWAFVAIHEAYYGDDKDVPDMISVKPAWPQAEDIAGMGRNWRCSGRPCRSPYSTTQTSERSGSAHQTGGHAPLLIQ
jgi:hypothetical protein